MKKILFSSNLTVSEKQEFELHVKHNMKRAYFSALGFVGCHDDAVELSQEAFIRAYRNYKNFDNNKKFFTWYYKILKNLCLNFIRDSKKQKKNSIFEFVNSLESNENPISNIEAHEFVEKVQRALLELSQIDKEIIILKEFQNFSYKEISELMEVPIGTVMSKLFYARKKLADKLKGDYNG
ncbi:MAG: sigma-70 family RNA polymerase sigma factor [Melioribacteraceae bacterium]|nr:sigma-70 family RNA polymerase sigma factor [Melioribacteraceae bacterium]